MLTLCHFGNIFTNKIKASGGEFILLNDTLFRNAYSCKIKKMFQDVFFCDICSFFSYRS